MSCPTCGHSVSNIAGACTYCGAMMEVQMPPADEDGAAVSATGDEALPLPAGEVTEIPADAFPADLDEAAAIDEEQPNPNSSQSSSESLPEAETAEPSAAANDVFAYETPADSGEAEIETVDAEPEAISRPEAEVQPSADNSSSEIEPGKIVDLDSVMTSNENAAVEEKPISQEPQDGAILLADEPAESVEITAETESNGEENQSAPEPEVVDLGGEEPGESETLDETIVELVETEAARQEPVDLSVLDTASAVDSAEETKATSEDRAEPENEAEAAADAEPEAILDSGEETIILDISDEVQEAADESPDKSITPAVEPGTTALADALKIEKAAQDMAEAIEQQKAKTADAKKKKEQKAALAKAQAVKKQKAALAKARAQKKQKMIMAKAAALKRKKAAQTNTRASKKQAPEVKPPEEAGHTGAVEGPGRGSELQALLEKYKGQAIGINYDNSAEIREAQLVDANLDYFRVFVESKNQHYTYPFKTILSIIEGKDGVDVGESEKKIKFNVVIKVYPLVLF